MKPQEQNKETEVKSTYETFMESFRRAEISLVGQSVGPRDFFWGIAFLVAAIERLEGNEGMANDDREITEIAEEVYENIMVNVANLHSEYYEWQDEVKENRAKGAANQGPARKSIIGRPPE